MKTNKDKIAQIIGTSLAAIILGSMAWKQLKPIAHELFKSELEHYTEDVIRKHVTDFNDNTIDHHFKLPSQFTIEEIKCDPVEDTFGCFGEVQRILALVKFKPQSNNYYTPVSYEKLDLISCFRTFVLPENDIPGFDSEHFRDIVISFSRDHERLIFLEKLSADAVKESHTLIYNSLRNRKSKDDPWHELKPYLTYGGHPSDTYSQESIKNINYVILSHDKKLDRIEEHHLNDYKSYAKKFWATVQHYQNSLDRILHYHEAENQNANLSLDKWNGGFDFPTISSYVKSDVDYSDTDAAKKLLSARNEYKNRMRSLHSNMEKARESYDNYWTRCARADITLRQVKGRDPTNESKAQQEYMFCKGAMQGSKNHAEAQYAKFIKFAKEYLRAATACYQNDKLEVKRLADELNSLMKNFPRR